MRADPEQARVQASQLEDRTIIYEPGQYISMAPIRGEVSDPWAHDTVGSRLLQVTLIPFDRFQEIRDDYAVRFGDYSQQINAISAQYTPRMDEIRRTTDEEIRRLAEEMKTQQDALKKPDVDLARLLVPK